MTEHEQKRHDVKVAMAKFLEAGGFIKKCDASDNAAANLRAVKSGNDGRLKYVGNPEPLSRFIIQKAKPR